MVMDRGDGTSNNAYMDNLSQVMIPMQVGEITAEEAEEYIGYNTYGVGGDNFPVIISLIGEEN